MRAIGPAVSVLYGMESPVPELTRALHLRGCDPTLVARVLAPGVVQHCILEHTCLTTEPLDSRRHLAIQTA